MIVGVLRFKSNFDPHVGGGHTVETEVYNALVRCAPASSHTFVVLTKGNLPQPDVPNVRVERLTGGRRRKAKLLAGVSALASWPTRKGRAGAKSHAPRKRWLERVLVDAGVDFMWYPSPGAATTRIPYLTVVWDLQHRRQPFFPEVSAAMEWERRERTYQATLQRAAVVITGTEVGKEEIERFYGLAPERIRVVPLPTPSFPPAGAEDEDSRILASHGLTPGYLFYPAQFWPHKNHAGLFLATRILREQFGMEVPLVLVGSDKGNRDHVDRLAAELGLTEQVRMLGFVSRAELAALYRRALALVFVSYFGPDNLPPLEAFSLGCPVVASAVPGATEQLGDAALLVNPANPREIAEAVHKLSSDAKLRGALVERGHKRARLFQGDDFVNAVLEILDEFESVRRCWKTAS